MFTTEDDPEGKKHCIEDALPDVTKQQHPGPVKPNGKPFHRDIDESHGNPKSKYDSEKVPIRTMLLWRANFKNLKQILRIEMLFIQILAN